MPALKLPEQLKGPWDHALIMTYGMNLPFFESAVWNQFPPRCRNKIILADGRRYLEACENYAENSQTRRISQVRHLNHWYIAEGIYAPRAAHAKLILLTSAEQGRLLVGSGNLNWEGFASGGELFTQYEYPTGNSDALAAFVAARQFIEELVARGYVSATATWRIQHLLDQTPWLYRPSIAHQAPVRHNLVRSFLEQLQEAVDGEAVEELWIHAPFHDKDELALKRLLQAFAPRRVMVLVQPGMTSADPAALKRVLEQFGGRCEVRPFTVGSERLYVHAKLYLLKLPSRAVCLQGSPNLSQVALLLHGSIANIELANLLTGPWDAFGELLEALEIRPAIDIDRLKLEYRSGDAGDGRQGGSDVSALLSGEWKHDRLKLYFRETPPSPEGASLVIAGHPFPLRLSDVQGRMFEVVLAPEARELLGRPVPVSVQWGKGSEQRSTNPIFPCSRSSLEDVLEAPDASETLQRVGDLDLNDAEFERLLEELSATLVIDRRSVWQLMGRHLPAAVDVESDEGLHLSLADIDYEALRQHPKIQQYLYGSRSSSGGARSRLQLILKSITDHFQGVVEPALPAGLQTLAAVEETLDAVAVEDEQKENDVEEAEVQHRSSVQRVRRLLKGFIGRYLRGIRSPDFQEFAGPEVMAENYAIFGHVLWRLFAKDWVEPEFVVDSLVETWAFFWGGAQERFSAGYLPALPQNQRDHVLPILHDMHIGAQFLAALYYSARLTELHHWESRRLALRDLWRRMLRECPFHVTDEMLGETRSIVADIMRLESPSASAIVDDVTRLADFETRRSFLHALEERLHCHRDSCVFKQGKVRRQVQGRAYDELEDILVVPTSGDLSGIEVAITILQFWMRCEHLDYYRITVPDGDRGAYYEAQDQHGLYWNLNATVRKQDLDGLTPAPLEWDAVLSSMHTLAAQADGQANNAPADTMSHHTVVVCCPAQPRACPGSGERFYGEWRYDGVTRRRLIPHSAPSGEGAFPRDA